MPCVLLAPLCNKHEVYKHQQDEADEPPGSGEGLGHGERACAHDEVKHVH